MKLNLHLKILLIKLKSQNFIYLLIKDLLIKCLLNLLLTNLNQYFKKRIKLFEIKNYFFSSFTNLFQIIFKFL